MCLVVDQIGVNSNVKNVKTERNQEPFKCKEITSR